MSSSRYFYGGVFIVSGCLMALQILQSRIFSVTTWYHLAFLVISIAMFGMTMAALHIHKGDRKKQEKEYGTMMARASEKLGLYIILALLGQLFIPIVHHSFIGTAFSLPALSLLTVLPYYQAGIVLTLALTRTPFPIARTYGIDLVGAAAGCLFALLLMKSIDAPSGVLFTSVMAFAAALCFARVGGGSYRTDDVKFLLPFVFLALCLNVFSPKPFIYPVWIKSNILTQNQLIHDEWNAISRVTVMTELKDYLPFLWGPSPITPLDMKTNFHVLKIDGDAGTPINEFNDDLEEIKFLEYDVTTLAYSLPNINKTAVIGVGGGRDALTAHYFGATDITAMDVNNVQISLLTEVEPFKSYAGIADLPGIKLVHSEARSWFSRNQEKFDLIQMSLIDTWAATGAGAFALSENGVYTTDAWGVFFDDLNDNGVLTVSRWYVDTVTSETERLLALAVQSLLDKEIKNPQEHIVMAISQNVATLILSKTPFTKEQLKALNKRADKFQFQMVVSPDKQDTPEIFDRIVSVENTKELKKLTSENEFDISPPNDNRPFFFNQVRLAQPWKTVSFILENQGEHVPGHAQATLNLYLIIVFALLMVVFAILVPLRGAIKDSDKNFVIAGTGWFLLIGLGFMLLEVALLQRMSIFLGHPVYGLSVVLFSLVLSTGVGSLLSEKLPLMNQSPRSVWIMITMVLAIILSFTLGPVFDHFAEASLSVRAMICVSLTILIGILLGFGFPTGMSLIESIDAKPTAWFWGINGAAGVMGSALAVAFNIALGLNWTIILGGLCYGLLIVPSSMLAKMKKG